MTDHISLTTGTVAIGGAAHDASGADEQFAEDFYGSSLDDPKAGWITAASLQLGPHTPDIWTVPAVADDEPEGLAWLPRNAWKTEGDL